MPKHQMGTFNGLGGDCTRINYLASLLSQAFSLPAVRRAYGRMQRVPVGLLVQLLVYSRYA